MLKNEGDRIKKRSNDEIEGKPPIKPCQLWMYKEEIAVYLS